MLEEICTLNSRPNGLPDLLQGIYSCRNSPKKTIPGTSAYSGVAAKTEVSRPCFSMFRALACSFTTCCGLFSSLEDVKEDSKQRTLKLLQKDFKTIQCILSKLC